MEDKSYIDFRVKSEQIGDNLISSEISIDGEATGQTVFDMIFNGLKTTLNSKGIDIYQCLVSSCYINIDKLKDHISFFEALCDMEDIDKKEHLVESEK